MPVTDALIIGGIVLVFAAFGLTLAWAQHRTGDVG